MKRLFAIPPYYCLEIDDGIVLVRSFSKHAKGRALTQQKTCDGYLRVKMKQPDGSFMYRLLHGLVAHFCLGSKPYGLTVNHKDGDKLNNAPANLEYISRAEQIAHAIKLGLHVSIDPKRSGRYKHGRAVKGRVATYKREWSEANRDRIRTRRREQYLQAKEAA